MSASPEAVAFLRRRTFRLSHWYHEIIAASTMIITFNNTLRCVSAAITAIRSAVTELGGAIHISPSARQSLDSTSTRTYYWSASPSYNAYKPDEDSQSISHLHELQRQRVHNANLESSQVLFRNRSTLRGFHHQCNVARPDDAANEGYVISCGGGSEVSDYFIARPQLFAEMRFPC